ncbi:hypothetical protein FRC17_007413, partial [Serendipita sp. 399]
SSPEPMADPQTDLRDSEAFPQGYGDMRLVTSDRVVFYFQRWLLAYMSPVFKDMFTIGDGKNERSQEISLQEESRIVDLLLRFTDPKKETPDLDFDVLPELLEAGRKYQIPELKDRVSRWMGNNISAVNDATSDLSSPRAIQLLEQGRTYGVPRFCQLALRSLIKKPYKDVFVVSLATSDLYEHLVTLRAERVRWFQTKLERVLGEGASSECLDNQKFTIADKDYIEICKAIMRVMHAICFEPSYACCMRAWSDVLSSKYIHNSRRKMEDFRNLCAILEAELPDLPRE